MAGRRESRGPGSPVLEPPDPDVIVTGLYQAHALALIRAAKLLVRDQQSAEDVVQDAFLSLYRALPRLRDTEQILPYLRAAVRSGDRRNARGEQGHRVVHRVARPGRHRP